MNATLRLPKARLDALYPAEVEAQLLAHGWEADPRLDASGCRDVPRLPYILAHTPHGSLECRDLATRLLRAFRTDRHPNANGRADPSGSLYHTAASERERRCHGRGGSASCAAQ